MAEIVDHDWPSAGHDLLRELARAGGRLCLICGEEADMLAERVSEDLRLGLGSVGHILTEFDEPPDASDLHDLLAEHQVLQDLDVLFWPDMSTNPVWVLRVLARRGPLLAVWPGVIERGRARYSQPGRPDHLESRLTDTVVLRPRPTRFPDEVPFTVERIVS